MTRSPLIALLRHPDPLMTAAFAANTPRHIRGIGSVLEVDSTGKRSERPPVLSPIPRRFWSIPTPG
jgi:hypothetical protein